MSVHLCVLNLLYCKVQQLKKLAENKEKDCKPLLPPDLPATPRAYLPSSPTSNRPGCLWKGLPCFIVLSLRCASVRTDGGVLSGARATFHPPRSQISHLCCQRVLLLENADLHQLVMLSMVVLCCMLLFPPW